MINEKIDNINYIIINSKISGIKVGTFEVKTWSQMLFHRV